LAGLRSDPLARGSLATLGATAALALALALVGLMLGVAGDRRDERGELFDLEAQGAAPATLRLHLRLRALIVAAFGLAGGIATGAILSRLVLSLVTVTASAAKPEPPLRLVLDVPLVAAAIALYALLAFLLVRAATRLGGATETARLARADELLDRVGLASKRDRRPGQLSGGEQQRVALCAALAHEPRIFLADEPTGELDAETADQVYALVGELVREHDCTTIVVSHDPESAKLADRIIRIRDGRVSEEWDRGDDAPDTIVVGRGGWLRLPEDLLLRAGIGERAAAELEDGRVVVRPAPGSPRVSVV